MSHAESPIYQGFKFVLSMKVLKPPKSGGAARRHVSSSKEYGSAISDGRADALCRHAAGRYTCPPRAARHPVADSGFLRSQYIGGRDSAEDD